MNARTRGRWPGVVASVAALVAVAATWIAVESSGPGSRASSQAAELGTSTTATVTTLPVVPESCSMVTAATLAAHVPGAVCRLPLVSTQQYGGGVATMADWQGHAGEGSLVALEVRLTIDPAAPQSTYANSRAAAAAVFPSFHDAIGRRELAGVGEQAAVIGGSCRPGPVCFDAQVDAVAGPVVVDVLASGYSDAEAAAVAAARDALAAAR